MFPESKLTRGDKIVLWTAVLILSLCSGVMGSAFGYYKATGQMPFQGSASVLPEITGNVTTSEQISEFLVIDSTNEIEYGEGFNCVESAILAARNAHWDGLPAEVVRLVFTDESSHMMLVFPTSDSGWIYVEPQTDSEVSPRVGGMYNGKVISSIDILRIEWFPFEEEK